MFIRKKLFVSLAFILLPASTRAATVYVVTVNQQFGTLDLGTGAFHQIGPNTPEGASGLVAGPNGSLLTLTLSGNLDAINPATGQATVVGATGLGDCTAADGKCPSNSANGLAEVGGKLYATDFGNNLYSLNASTGAAHLIGPTGVPPVPAGFPNFPDMGPADVFDESLYGVSGKLYAIFDATTFDPNTGQIVSIVVPPFVYQIDPSTGATTRIAPTLTALSASTDVNGAFYAFKADSGQVLTLDLTNGSTHFVTDYDPAVGFIVGAAPVPEPASIALAGIGIAGLMFLRASRAKRSYTRTTPKSL